MIKIPIKKGERLNNVAISSNFYLKNIIKHKTDESISFYNFDLYFNDIKLYPNMTITTYSIEGLRKEVMKLISIILKEYFK